MIPGKIRDNQQFPQTPFLLFIYAKFTCHFLMETSSIFKYFKDISI